MFRELFLCACSRSYPSGIPTSMQSRALYTIDVMLAWSQHNAGNVVKLCDNFWNTLKELMLHLSA